MLSKYIINTVAGLYGLLAMANIYALLLAWEKFREVPSELHSFYIQSAGLFLLVAFISLLLTYAIWTHKWWGRPLAIVFNCLCIMILLVDWWIVRSPRGETVQMSETMIIAGLALFGLATGFLFKKDVKDMFRKVHGNEK